MNKLIESDFKRHGLDKVTFSKMVSVFLFFPNPGLKFMTIFRLCQKYRKRNKILFLFYFLWLRRLKFKYGIDISYRTTIGAGFYIGHFGGIVVHGDVKIGNNCNISQGVTLGVSNSGKNKGTPTINDNVFIGPNAGVFGNIEIGSNVTIGANSVVTKTIPSHSTVVSSAITVLDKDLSENYIHNRY